MSSPRRDDSVTLAVESPGAGVRVIRGGAARGTAYLAGTALTALAFALLLRHLGVRSFGQFSTVIAVATIAIGLAEAGLQTVGQRMSLRADETGRRTIIADILAIRLVATPLAVVGA